MLTGEQFNDKYRDHKFVKLTNKSEYHNDFQFQTGLNIDHIPFNPVGKCSAGGIYFTDINKYLLWLTYSCQPMHWTRDVIIPNDAQVYVENNKFKCDRIILGVRQPINWSDGKICKQAVRQKPSALRWVTDQTNEICKSAIKRNGYALRYVINQTNDICILAVKANGYALQYVKNQTDDIYAHLQFDEMDVRYNTSKIRQMIYANLQLIEIGAPFDTSKIRQMIYVN
jgi:hypothetical protein